MAIMETVSRTITVTPISRETCFSLTQNDAKGHSYQLRTADRFQELNSLYQLKVASALEQEEASYEELNQGLNRIFRRPTLRRLQESMERNQERLEYIEYRLSEPLPDIDYRFAPREQALYDADTIIRLTDYSLERSFSEVETSIQQDDIVQSGNKIRQLEINILNTSSGGKSFRYGAEMMQESLGYLADEIGSDNPELREKNYQLCEEMSMAYAKSKYQNNTQMFSDLGWKESRSMTTIEQQFQAMNPGLENPYMIMREAKFIGLERVEKEQEHFKQLIDSGKELTNGQSIVFNEPFRIDYSKEKHLLNPYTIGVSIVRPSAKENEASRAPSASKDMGLERA
ncbi:hypothetical protein [Listeria newyorkensis]|uniref:hypothetical protein n=1 Tax=Listeria newyorkensis TaxID=1497681 RepID=UPI00051DA33A|nr:hypothetical protein [Listeria newyorkensis]KGL43622.1 hypothetical protein EP58_07745 [Listeria newyorkensis]